jgi:hypothetical protein
MSNVGFRKEKVVAKRLTYMEALEIVRANGGSISSPTVKGHVDHIWGILDDNLSLCSRIERIDRSLEYVRAVLCVECNKRLTKMVENGDLRMP